MILNEYMRTHSSSWKEDFEKMGIDLQFEGDYVLLKYNMLRNPTIFSWNPFTKEARGIIVDTTNYRVVCKSFDKFFNAGESESAIGDINWRDGVVVKEKMDGTCMRLWFDHKGIGWRLSTLGAITPESRFVDMFWDAAAQQHLPLSLLDKNSTYVFELCGYENPIVCKYDFQIKLFYLSSFANYNGQEIMGDIGIERPRQYEVNSFEECKSIVEKMNGGNHIDEEGVVVWCPSTGARIKIKNARYFEMHRIAANGKPSFKNLMNAIVDDNAKELESYFPYLHNRLEFLRKEYKRIVCEVACALTGYVEEYERVYREDLDAWARANHNRPYAELFLPMIRYGYGLPDVFDKIKWEKYINENN